jgi:threonyl-tRNA synthetase
MINITFPDGSVKPFVEGITAYEVAESISPRLAEEVLAADVNGNIVDLNFPIRQDSELKLLQSTTASIMMWTFRTMKSAMRIFRQ